MNLITKALNRLFKSGNQLELNKIKPIVSKINDLEKNFLNFKNENFEDTGRMADEAIQDELRTQTRL